MTLREKPHEKGAGYEVLYTSVTNGTFRQRTIVTRPPGKGPHPAVLGLVRCDRGPATLSAP